MNKRDQKFFDEHWEDWINRNPPPPNYIITKYSSKKWAEWEMPCRGILGRFLFKVGLWLQKKK